MIIYGKEKEILKAQKRSLAAWINNTVGVTLVDADNLIPKLSTGVILCRLAKCIQNKVDEMRGCCGKEERLLHLKYWESAKRETFFARDNAEMFIRWCKSFGVRDAVLFESDGLVLQSQPRTVILCLLELARIASRYGVLLPPPIQLTKTASLALEDEDEDTSGCSEDDAFFFATTRPTPTRFLQRWDSGCSSGPSSPSSPNHSSTLSKGSPSPVSSLKRSGIPRRKDKNVVVVVRSRSEDPLDDGLTRRKSSASPRVASPRPRRSSSSVRTDTISSRLRSSLNRSASSLVSSSCKSLVAEGAPDRRHEDDYVPIAFRRRRSDLDKKVLEIARKYHKDESKICRLSEGHYSFSGKNVYLRIVRGSNVVVRLGGGWDTLEHFLSTLDFNRASAYTKQPKKVSDLPKRTHSIKISPY